MKHSLTRMVIIALLIVSLSACNDEPPPQSQLAPLNESHVYFELPEGWEVIERAPGYVRAAINQPAVESGAPNVELSLLQYSIFEGGDDVAKYHYEDYICPSSPPCTPQVGPHSELQTLSLDSGVKVYIAIRPVGHWPYEPSGEIPVARSSSLFFSKDGYTYHFTLWDNFAYYRDVLEALTSTIRLERR